MTKEELKQEAEEYDLIIRFKSNKPKYEIRDYIINHTLDEFDNLQMWDFKRSSEFAESREKRIAELEKENEMFKKAIEIIAQQRDDRDADISILENRIAELKAQIEKMKCCSNCDNWNWKHNKCEKKLKGDCFKHSKWVMRNF